MEERNEQFVESQEEVVEIGKRNSYENIVISVLILMIVASISVGFAILSSTLRIRGTAGIPAMSWDIHFENLVESEVTNITPNEPAQIAANKLDINFDINLALENDKYAFDTEIVNSGTIDAQINTIELYGLDAINSKYLDYDVKYIDGTDLAVGDVLRAGERRPIHVEITLKGIAYKNNDSDTEEKFNLAFGLRYVQSEQ